MKILFYLLVFVSTHALAHEGGHGHVKEGGKFGGVMAPVFLSKDANQPHKNAIKFKAELVRAENGSLSLYFFDNKMKLIDLKDFANEIQAKLEVKKKGKFSYFGSFNLSKNGNHFKGQLPVVEYRPFNIDLFFNKDKNEYFVGFSNLD